MTGKPARKSHEDGTGRYLQEIAQYRLLRSEEEPQLFATINAALKHIEGSSLQDVLHSSDPEVQKVLIDMTAAYQIIYSTNLRLAVAIAKKYNGYSRMELMDLISEGNYGIHKAITRFSPDKGLKFSTYATWWVRSQVTRAIADQSRLIRIPVHAHDAYLKLLQDMKEVTSYMGRDATAEDMAELYGDDITKIERLLTRGSNYHRSLDATLDNGSPATNNDEGTAFGDLLPQLAYDPLDGLLEDSFERESVSILLTESKLDTRSQVILCMRMGLMPKHLEEIRINDMLLTEIHGVDQNKTLEEVGNLMGVTRERIRQLEAHALVRLRKIIARGGVDTSLLPAYLLQNRDEQ